MTGAATIVSPAGEHQTVIIRPVNGVVMVLGAALVIAVLLLVVAIAKSSADQAHSDAVRACLTQTAADADRIGALATAATNASTAAAFKLVFLSSDMREHPPAGPDDPRVVQARDLQHEVVTNAEAASRYTPRSLTLLTLRTKAAANCTEDPGYTLPPDLLTTEP